MPTKTKRTYNISEESVATVKRLVDTYHIAPSQDALIEYAISELARRVRDEHDALLWSEAANDPDFRVESETLEALFAEDDRRAWQP